MAKLSARLCETAKPDASGKDRLLGDGDGLFLRVRPTGSKMWTVEFEYRGRRRKATIGVFDPVGASGDSIAAWLKYGRLSLGQARSIASQWKADRRAGRDPVTEREERLATETAHQEAARQLAAAEATKPLVHQVFAQFMRKHISGKASAPDIEYRLNRFAELLGEKRIREVTRQDVIAALEQIAEGRRKGRTAKQLAGEVLIQAKRAWRFAETRGWIESSCIERLSRQDFDARPRKRDVVLGFDEVVELWQALRDPSRTRADSVTVAALRILILTGQREREVTDAEWQEFDFDQVLWRIPAHRTKARRAHVVHLAPEALAILEELKLATGTQRYVFASPMREGQPIYGRSVNNALSMMFKRGALPRVSACHVHDLRRTLITRLPDLGFEPFIGHKIANHVLSGVFAHYNYNEYLEQRKDALMKWASAIESLAVNRNVIPLHRQVA